MKKLLLLIFIATSLFAGMPNRFGNTTLPGDYTFPDSTTINKLTVQGNATFEDSTTFNGDVVFRDTVKGDLITDGFIKNARLQNVDSIPSDSLVGYVTFTFDDNYLTQYDSIFPMFTDSGAVGVLSIVTSAVGAAYKMSWAQMKQMYDAGWEIASHSVTHTNFTTILKDSVDKELRYSQNALAAYGIDAKSFVYPYNTQNKLIKRLTAQYYNCARGGVSGRNVAPINTFALNYWDYQYATSLAAAKSQIDSTVAKKSWLIFMIHSIETGENTIAAIAEVLSYAKTQGLKVVTLQQGLEYTGNIIEIGNEDFVVSKTGISGVIKPKIASINPWKSIWCISSGTKNTISADHYLNAAGWTSFDSVTVDSVFVLGQAVEDSNKVDSLFLGVYSARTYAPATLIASGTDWGSLSFCSYTYTNLNITIPTNANYRFNFKPKAESNADKMRIYNVILYGRPK